MAQDRIAAVKLITGEEIICNLIELDTEGSYTTLTFSNPLRIQLRERRRSKNYTLEPWLCIKNNTLHCIISPVCINSKRNALKYTLYGMSIEGFFL